jgi:hypothetical protein
VRNWLVMMKLASTCPNSDMGVVWGLLCLHPNTIKPRYILIIIILLSFFLSFFLPPKVCPTHFSLSCEFIFIAAFVQWKQSTFNQNDK